MHGHYAEDFVFFVTKRDEFIAIYTAEGIDLEWAGICADRYMADAANTGYSSDEGVRLAAKRELAAMNEEGEAWKQVKR